MNYRNRNHEPRLKAPRSVTVLGWAAFGLALSIFLLDIVAFFLAIISLAGRRTKIKYPKSAIAVQASEAGVAILGVVLDFTLCTTQFRLGREAKRLYIRGNVKSLRKCLSCCLVPHQIIFLLAWVALAASQAQYVPLLGHETLRQCTWGKDSYQYKKCKMVDGTWVAAVLFCVLRFSLLVVNATLMRRLRRSEDEFDDPSKAASKSQGLGTKLSNLGRKFKWPYAALETQEPSGESSAGRQSRVP